MPIPSQPDDRRGFLRSMFGEVVDRMVAQAEERVAPRQYTRPPGALPEVGFIAACTRCGECVTACPVHAIHNLGADAGLAAGTPFLDLKLQPCVACADMPCARACPTDALTVPDSGWEGYRLATLELDTTRCVTFRARSCRACADACPLGERALVMDDAGHPVIRREGCVGCGVCVRACITTPSSLRLFPLER